MRGRHGRRVLAFAGAFGVLGVAAVLAWRPLPSGPPPETAEIAAGRELAQACTVCHALDLGASPRVGPHLWGIVGRPIGGVAGYGYSRALTATGGPWTAERLDRFLADPAGTMPGTAMAYGGLPDAADRARLIAFLATLGD